MELTFGQVLATGTEDLRKVYFPIDACVSLFTRLDGKPALEVAVVGGEGMTGAQLALGVEAEPAYSLVQGPGAAWSVEKTAFQYELARNAALSRSLLLYLHVTMTQLARSAVCLRFHQIGPRLARRLLMAQDRARSSDFRATHQSLALVLGVRRASVTLAAAALQRRGLVGYHRGQVTVLDRRGLKKAACTCYAADARSYAHLRAGPALA